jgi:hypothetical protein
MDKLIAEVRALQTAHSRRPLRLSASGTTDPYP